MIDIGSNRALVPHWPSPERRWRNEAAPVDLVAPPAVVRQPTSVRVPVAPVSTVSAEAHRESVERARAAERRAWEVKCAGMSPEDILDGARSIRRDLSTIVSSVPIDVEGLVQMSECEWIDLSALLREHCKDGRLQPGNPFTMVLNESEYPDYNRLKRELAWLRAR